MDVFTTEGEDDDYHTRIITELDPFDAELGDEYDVRTFIRKSV